MGHTGHSPSGFFVGLDNIRYSDARILRVIKPPFKEMSHTPKMLSSDFLGGQSFEFSRGRIHLSEMAHLHLKRWYCFTLIFYMFIRT